MVKSGTSSLSFYIDSTRKSVEMSPIQGYWITGESKTGDIINLLYEMISNRIRYVNRQVHQVNNYIDDALSLYRTRSIHGQYIQ